MARELEEPLVQCPELMLLVLGELALDDDQEVDVAVLVGVAEREGALEIDADQLVAEPCAQAGNELCQHGVQLRERRGIHGR